MTRRLDRGALLLAALGLALALPVLTYPMGRDQGMYANIAQTIRAGGLPFIDMWDVKPPAIYYIYAAGISLFGATPAALRALDLIAAPLTMLALFHLTDAFAGRRAARWAMLLFPVFYFTETFASLTQSDSLVILPMTWAALCALRVSQSRPGSRRALWWAFACGLLCALVIWFKHYYALFAVALAVAHIWARIRAGSAGGLRAAPTDQPNEVQEPVGARRNAPFALGYEMLTFTSGGLLIGIPSLIFFASNGMLREMLTIAQGTAQYNAQAFGSLSAFWAQMGNYVWFRWWHWGPLIVLAVSYQFSVLSEKRLNSQPSALAPHPLILGSPLAHLHSPLLFLWIVAGLVFVVIQAKGFDTHWIPLLPPLVILASGALDKWLALIERLVSRRMSMRVAGNRKQVAVRWALAGAVIVLFGAILAKDTWVRAWPYLTGQQTQRGYWRQFQAGDLNAGDSLRMARWLQDRTNEGDSVYIWGFRSEVAFMAGLRPATRFQAQFALVGDRYPQAWKQENVDTLWAALPEYALVVRADSMPWVTGTQDDSNTILAREYKALEDWLNYNYERDAEIDNFLIWRRKT